MNHLCLNTLAFTLCPLDAKIRPDAILIFGVNEMSTKDVFDYFQDYAPGSIEWIDDISCMPCYVAFSISTRFNSRSFCFIFTCLGIVVWEDENSAKRAFVNMGTVFTPPQDSSAGM